MAERGDMFTRWARRKRAVAAEAEAGAAAMPAPKPDPAETAEPESEAEVLARLRLPVPESLRLGDDFSVFMKAGVPEFLRRRALRVLWRSNPVLANLDGLNDYDADFNAPEMTKAVLATAYRVGRGFLRAEEEAEISHQNAEECSPEAGEAPEATGKAEGPSAEPDHVVEANAGVGEAPPEAEQTEADQGPRPRRMRFQS